MSQSLNAKQVSNQSMPKLGWAKTLPYTARLATLLTDSLDLTNAVSQGIIDQIQSVWIDNSNGALPFVLLVDGVGQATICPAYSQGWFPILTTYPQQFTFSGSGADVKLFFNNVPMPVGTWYAGPKAANNSPMGLPLTDLSAVSVAASTVLIPANVNRQYLFIKAPELDDLWISLNGSVAGIDALGSFKLPKSFVYESAERLSNMAITVFCATAALNITAFEG